MPIPTAITDLSTDPASNSPNGDESPVEGDNHIRTTYAFVRQLYDGDGEFVQSGVDSVSRTVLEKLREIVSLADKGGVGDSAGTTGSGTNNVTALQNAATDAVHVHIGEGIWRFASTVQFTGPMRITGNKPVINKDGSLDGTWVYFDHTNRGFYFRDGVSDLNHFAVVEDIGVIRNQPTPGGGWTPTAHDYDIQSDTAYVEIRNVVPLRSTKHINIRNAARCTIDGVRGQVFDEGIKLERTADVPRLLNIHWWPYWSQDSNVTTYQKDNCKGIVFNRADNPDIVNYFGIYARHGWYFEETADGSASKVHAVNVDFDQTDFGISIAASSTVTGQFTNITHQAGTGRTTGRAFNVLGEDCRIDIQGLESGRSVQEVVNVEGQNNVVTIHGLRAAGWANAGGGESMLRIAGAGTANTVVLVGPPQVFTADYLTASTPTYNIGATHTLVRVDGDYQEQNWTPTLSFATPGDLAVTYSVRLGRVTKKGRSVSATFDIVSSSFTHTTASGNLRISGLPFTSVNVTGLEHQGALEWQGITKAGYTNIIACLTENASIMTFRASGSGVSVSNVDASNMPTGGTVRLRGTINYIV